MINLKFFGTGGQGVVTAAKIFSKAYSLYEGNYAITIPAYGHERRGAPVNASIICDEKPVMQNCFVYNPDIVMVMDSMIIEKDAQFAMGIHKESLLVLNVDQKDVFEQYTRLGFSHIYYVSGTDIALRHIGKGIPNSAMLGALAKTGIISIDSVMEAIKSSFGEEAGAKNAAAAKEAYEETKCL
jgi:2-oxoacid:acceptor oxidoreductase gamma subunit (pyruvate/2-ketoisovalerate family)